MRDVIAALATIESESAKVKLAVNKGKTKYMVSKGKESKRTIGSHVNAGTYNFEVVDEFIYFGGSVTVKAKMTSTQKFCEA